MSGAKHRHNGFKSEVFLYELSRESDSETIRAPFSSIRRKCPYTLPLLV